MMVSRVLALASSLALASAMVLVGGTALAHTVEARRPAGLVAPGEAALAAHPV